MKSINQFDYPSKEAQSYKASSQISDSQDSKDHIKARYKQNLQYHMEIERNKAKQTQKIKKQQQSKRKKQQLYSELEKKKRQLQNLQILKQQAQQNQKKSYELAIIKQEQDRIKREEDQRRKQQFDQNATLRFSQAMKKLHDEKEEQSFKERLAEQRRKTAQEFQRIQRVKAEKYRSLVEEKQKNNQKQNNSAVDQYRKTFKQFISSPNQDYNRTCVHNLKVVSQIKKEQEDALQRGKLQDDEIRQKSQERRKLNQENVRKSKQRGRNAFMKIQRQKQYEHFQKQTSEEQKKYNLNRIQAGKKNQFVGVKPTTLNQMQIGKKMRSQQEFDKMFYSKSIQPPQSSSRPATKFEIVQRRIPRKQQEDNDSDQKPRKVKSYLKQRQESQMPAVSEGKYSFEQQCYSQFKNQSRSQSNIHDQNEQNQQEEEQQNFYQRANTKNALKQTRIPDDKPRHSPQQSRSNNLQQEKMERNFKNQGNRQKQGSKEESQGFDSNAMLKKYGLSNARPDRQTVQKSKKPQNKRKVVELSNICQNKVSEKQELNYSSQSEQDSLA